MAMNSGTQATFDHQPRAFLCLGLLPLLLVSVALVALPLGCQKTASKAKAPATQDSEPAVVEAAPRIEMDKTVHDFGQIGPETKHSAQFTIKNAGSAPLKVVRVESCCEVVTRGVSSGQEYAAGETGTLELDYRAGSLPGSMERKLYIQSNDPSQSIVTLTIKATIVRRVDHEPKRLKLFLNRKNAGCDDITLMSLDDRPFSIKGFRSTANAITAEFDRTVKATKFVLKPKADMDKLQGNLKGQISIDLTHPEARNVRLLYDVLPEFTISPPQIMVSNLKPEEPVQREIWILSNYQDEFEIESVSSQKGAVKLVDQKKVGNRYQLRIEVTAPSVEDDTPVLSDVLQVKIDGGEALSIQCLGFYARK